MSTYDELERIRERHKEELDAATMRDVRQRHEPHNVMKILSDMTPKVPPLPPYYQPPYTWADFREDLARLRLRWWRR